MTTALNYCLIALLFLAWIGLFAIKDATREATARVSVLERQIDAEEEAISTLMTDWAILNEPGYLQRLAQTQLGMGTMAPRQIVSMSALPPVPLGDYRDRAGGTFLASARGYQQFPSAQSFPSRREMIGVEHRAAGWVRPLPRPAPGGEGG